MFQLIYLTFTQPRADPAMFSVMTSRRRPRWPIRRHRRSLPSPRRCNAILSQNHLRARMMTPEIVDQMNLDKSMAFYKDRFADASDFTFVFVGSFDARDDEAARRAVSGRLAVDTPEGDLEGRRPQYADRRHREARREGHRAEEPGRHRLHRPVPVQPGAARRDPRDGPGARDPAARVAARGSRRHLQRLGVGRLLEDSARGVHGQHRLRLQPRSHRRARERTSSRRSNCSRRTDPQRSRWPT